ncbi:hypothetical protein Pmani_036885 [Petrolisthes manimaculis]|uniref:Uncharacterized protein n=1 Tax=Petrolisthes manimaculis TaxID=1843537 RepID=A0AAE1NIW2_9EUCA|nr:hypothetical protein Pmani_036885 [Petrolisthes manimaculis]
MNVGEFWTHEVLPNLWTRRPVPLHPPSHSTQVNHSHSTHLATQPRSTTPTPPTQPLNPGQPLPLHPPSHSAQVNHSHSTNPTQLIPFLTTRIVLTYSPIFHFSHSTSLLCSTNSTSLPCSTHSTSLSCSTNSTSLPLHLAIIYQHH